MRTDVESFFFSARVCALGGNCLEFCFGFLNILFERVYEADDELMLNVLRLSLIHI